MTNSLVLLAQSQPNSGWAAPVLIDQGGGVEITAASNLDGRVEVVFIGSDQQVYHVWQNQEGSASSSFSSKASFGFQGKHVAMGSNSDGRLEFFFTDLNDNLHHCWQSSPNFGAWRNEPVGTAQAKQLSINQNSDGRLELFYIGMDDNLYHSWQSAPSSGWQQSPFQGRAKQISLGKNLDGRLELFYIGMDDQIYHNWQRFPSQGPWDGGSGGGDAASFGNKANYLEIGINRDGRLELFWIGLDNAIYHNWQNEAGSDWHGAIPFGGFAKTLCLCKDDDGRIELFFEDLNGFTYHSWQSSPSSGPWQIAPREHQASTFASITHQKGEIMLFYMGSAVMPPPLGTAHWSWPAFNNGHVFVEQMDFRASSDGGWVWTAKLHDDSSLFGDNWALGVGFVKLGHGSTEVGSLGATISGPPADGGVNQFGFDPWIASSWNQVQSSAMAASFSVGGDFGQLLGAIGNDLEIAVEVAGKVLQLLGDTGDVGSDEGGDDTEIKKRPSPLITDAGSKPVTVRAQGKKII